MRIRLAALLFAPLLLAGAGIQAAAQNIPVSNDDSYEDHSLTPDIIAVDRDRQKRMTVPVSINGSGPYRFMIDTGSERTILSTDIATQLGLERLPGAKIVGVAGIIPVDIAYVSELTMGRQTYSGLQSPLLIDSHMGADGILGLDGLQSQQVLFNFNNSTISVLDSRKPQTLLDGEEIVITAKRKSGQLIFTNATINGVRTDVIIDTGAHTSIGNLALRKKLFARKKDRPLYTTKLSSVTGQTIDADVIIAGKLVLDRLYVPELAIAFADTTAFESLGLNDRPALLLGMDVLRMFKGVSINFANRKISFILRDEKELQADNLDDDMKRTPRA